MKDDLITVVVPVYNVEKFLVRCVDSIINQTYKKLEILLINDGSTDSSGELCDRLALRDSRIRVIHQGNHGIAYSRNVGIDNANGEYLAYVDSDDYIEKDMIEYLYMLVLKYKVPMSLCGHITIENGRVRKNNEAGDLVLSDYQSIKSMLYDDGMVDTAPWAKLFHISLFKNIRWPEGKLFEDVGILYKIYMTSQRIACGLACKYTYFIRPKSITTGSFDLNKFDMLEMTDKMAVDVLKKYPSLLKGIIRRRVYSRFSTLNKMILNNAESQFVGERKEIIQFIKKYAFNVLSDSKVSSVDKIAVILLIISERLYSLIWRYYKKRK